LRIKEKKPKHRRDGWKREEEKTRCNDGKGKNARNLPGEREVCSLLKHWHANKTRAHSQSNILALMFSPEEKHERRV